MMNASKICGLEGRPYWVVFFSFVQLSVLYFVRNVLVVINVSR